MTQPYAWRIVDAGSWGIATTDTPADMSAALELTGSWAIPSKPAQAFVRRDQWGNLPTAPPAPPTLTAMVPNTGPVAGGTQSAIQGTGLTGTTHVFYGANAAADFRVANPTTIVATSPPATLLQPGNVNVSVLRGVGSNPVQFDYQ